MSLLRFFRLRKLRHPAMSTSRRWSLPALCLVACVLSVKIFLPNARNKQLSTPTRIYSSNYGPIPVRSASKRGFAGGLSLATLGLMGRKASSEQLETMEALKGKGYGKTRMRFSDYTQTPTGLQYQDLRVGQGKSPLKGDECVIDWSGYTIGYYGRPFEARDKAKGGDFTGDEKELYRLILGENKVIPAFEEALQGMKEGGIRRIIVPVELGYPDNDMRKKGPKPTTFSGKRALGFVLENQGMIDKTLLFDIELIKVRGK
ncbi:hypothetical protein AAMO2058_001108900 [Amorphochlora amoebiformis]